MRQTNMQYPHHGRQVSLCFIGLIILVSRQKKKCKKNTSIKINDEP